MKRLGAVYTIRSKVSTEEEKEEVPWSMDDGETLSYLMMILLHRPNDSVVITCILSLVTYHLFFILTTAKCLLRRKKCLR